ncbi:MAG: 30S ribosomal protein S17 [Candidatus Spechtbacterales bacterium]
METEKNTKKNRKKMTGTVVSDKMQKTLVVQVSRLLEHPRYKKRMKVSKRYKAHYEGGDYSMGDKVEIEETRPMSKTKKWKVLRKIS